LKNIGLILIALTLFLAGCAHKSNWVSSPETADPRVPANQDVIFANTGRQSTKVENSEAIIPGAMAIAPEEVSAIEDPGYVADPIEPWNRAMFLFNDKFYFWVMKPLAKGYRAVVPRPARSGVQNFFNNLTTPVRIVSCLLQGKGNAAGFEFSRFLINTTFGVFGFGNPSKKFPELNPPEEDLGQTLGSYGIGDGFYIIWPFLGPSTLRDSAGMLGDYFLNPVGYVKPPEASIGLTGYEALNKTSFRIGDYESLKDAALSPYEAFRDAYIQHRKKKITE